MKTYISSAQKPARTSSPTHSFNNDSSSSSRASVCAASLISSLMAEAIKEEIKEAAQTDARDEDDESLLKEWVGLLVRAGFWALLIYVFIFQVSVVDGPSMYSTFFHAERLVVD